MKLTTPTVHMNGTTGKELVELRRQAVGALLDAIDRLRMAAPNARDYYVRGDDGAAFKAATEAHATRMETLRTMVHDLTEEAMEIMDQPGADRP